MKVHSTVDYITNSSSEFYSSSLIYNYMDVTRAIITEIMLKCQCDKKIDEVFTYDEIDTLASKMSVVVSDNGGW
jgi:hypothetical protein